MTHKLIATIVVTALFSVPVVSACEHDDCWSGPEYQTLAVRGPTIANASLEAEDDIELLAEYQAAARLYLHPISIASPVVSPECNGDIQNLVKTTDSINDKIKPIKELAGYVRSPQGLAVKLVNDHLFKIPAWIGYAMDPIGAIKNKAIDEARSHVRGAITQSLQCAEPSAEELVLKSRTATPAATAAVEI